MTGHRRQALEGCEGLKPRSRSGVGREREQDIACALFEDERAEAAIAETDALMASTAADLGGLDAKKVMIGSLYDDTLYVIGAGPIAEQFADLGLNFVPAPGATDSGLPEYSMENVDILAQVSG